MNHHRLLPRLAGLLILAAAGCTTPDPAGKPLRVGMVRDLPPLAFIQDDRTAGLEADFAHRLAKDLKRPLEVYWLSWDNLVPALLKNDIDVIMSGMTATPARALRVRFAEPYLRSGLVPIVRRKDADAYPDATALYRANVLAGYRLNTTAEKLASTNFERVVKSGYQNSRDAVFDLQRKRLDVYITDVASAAWIVSEFESDLKVLPFLLNREDLAWAVRPDDPLETDLSAALAAWRADGTLTSLLDKWIPFHAALKDLGP